MDPSRIQVRPARPADAEQVAGLARELATSFPFRRASFDASFPALIAAQDGCLLVAADQDDCLGYLLGFRHLTFYANGPVGWVEEVMVREQHRQLGIGRALMSAFERWASGQGCALVALATRRAAPFYRALGYQESAAYLRKVLKNKAAGLTDRLQEGLMNARPPFPPFTEETARAKVQAAEDAWNTRDPERVAGAYTEDSVWRNRNEFVTGRAEIVEFLRRKWERELDYALRKDLWAFAGNRIGVRFQYESRDASGQWWRSYGNELWEFTEEGLMRRREASINDLRISESDRRIHGPRPEAERGESFPLR